MIISIQEKNNLKIIKRIEEITGAHFISGEYFKSREDNHKFKKGESVKLFNLEDYPQFNGEIVIITSIREDSIYGKAYYFKTNNKELSEQLNWVYEYRLQKGELCQKQ